MLRVGSVVIIKPCTRAVQAADASTARARAAVSPSLKNLLLSVLAGGSVLVLIAVAVVGVSTFDKVTRKG